MAKSHHANSIADISPKSNGNLNEFVGRQGNEAQPKSADEMKFVTNPDSVGG